jgi:predicted DNA-binding transcriptional regulator AlpA
VSYLTCMIISLHKSKFMNQNIIAIPHEFEERLAILIAKILREELGATLEDANKRQDKALISQKEIAAYFDVSLVTIHKWRKNGLLPSPIKQGGKVFFSKAEIERLVQQRKGGGKNV